MNRQFSVKAFLVLAGLTLLSFTSPRKKITIFSIGDSTMADYDIEKLSKTNGGENYPLRGWMMMMQQFFNNDVIINSTLPS
ncbi:MAG: lipolytic protein family [Segetibacter sp.]|nr:lipolytic protein family [Segetibacter sp.]